MSLAVHKCMRNISPEMLPSPLLLLLLVPILWLLPLTGAAPSATTEQLDTGVVSFLFHLLMEKRECVCGEVGSFPASQHQWT